MLSTAEDWDAVTDAIVLKLNSALPGIIGAPVQIFAAMDEEEAITSVTSPPSLAVMFVEAVFSEPTSGLGRHFNGEATYNIASFGESARDRGDARRVVNDLRKKCRNILTGWAPIPTRFFQLVPVREPAAVMSGNRAQANTLYMLRFHLT